MYCHTKSWVNFSTVEYFLAPNPLNIGTLEVYNLLNDYVVFTCSDLWQESSDFTLGGHTNLDTLLSFL